MNDRARVTPRDLLAERGQLDDDVVAVDVGGRIVDLHTPVGAGADVRPVRRTDRAALDVIRHSTSHVMAQAVQRLFPGTQVTIGPAIEHGFYYDFDVPSGRFTDQDLGKIEKEMRRIISQNLPFRRKAMSRSEARALFESMGEKYKL